ncbi:MAG: histidine kinase [Aggregatilineales bacterium]
MLRWILLLGFCMAVIVVRNPMTIVEFDQISDLALALGVGIVVTIAYGAMIAFKPLRPYAIYGQIAGDLLITGFFVYVSMNSQPVNTAGLPFYSDAGVMLLITGISCTMMLTGVLRLGAASGLAYGLGIVLAIAAALVIHPLFNIDAFINNPLPYIPPIFFLALVGTLAGIWSNGFHEDNSASRRQLLDDYEKMEIRVEKMQARVRLLSEMTTKLNSTLNFQAILDATANLGRMSVRSDRDIRTVSLVLLIEDENLLTVAAGSGIRDDDMGLKFTGEEGLIARTLNESEPILTDFETTRRDPELKRVVALRGIQSLLCIPLRAGLDIYGLIVIGTTEKNAFNGDSLETLKAIGVQATMAMQNAILYTGLMEEKDRLIDIEDNARKALVRDLHDVPTQTMSYVAMQLSVIPMIAERTPENLKKEVEELHASAMRAVSEIRHVMFTLRPMSLETRGLGAALKELTNKIENTYKQPITLDYDERVDKVLDKTKQGTIFYLIEEATSNARKYAEASMIKVQLRLIRGQLVIRIADNGKGFDTRNAKDKSIKQGSFGMVNMEERAGLAGGTLEMQSRKGKGTSITVKIPIDSAKLPPEMQSATAKRDTASHRKSIRETQSQRELVMGRGPLSPGS